MKCPKCGYTSFDYLESCKKCGVDLTEVKKRFNLRSILMPGSNGEVTHSISQPPFPKPDPRVPLRSGDSPLPVAEGAPIATRDLPFEGADPGAFTFEDPDAFSLEAMMAEAPAEEAAVAMPAPRHEAAFAAEAAEEGFEFREEGDGFSFDEGKDRDDPPLLWANDSATLDFPADPLTEVAADPAVGELLTFMEEIGTPAAAAEGDAAGYVRSHASPPPLPGPSFPAAVAAASFPAPGVEEKENEDEPIRITLDDFDRLASGGEELTLFASGAPLPGLEGEFAAPGWPSPPSAPLGGAPEAPPAGETDPGDADDAPAVAAATAAAPGAAPRLAASAADVLVLTAVFALFVLAGELALRPAGAASARPLAALLLDQAIPYFLVLFCLGFGYFTFFHFLLGQTLGKMLLRLRVETSTGEPVTFSRAFLRSTGGLLALLTAGVGYLPALRPGGRALNDRLAGTRVVQAGER